MADAVLFVGIAALATAALALARRAAPRPSTSDAALPSHPAAAGVDAANARTAHSYAGRVVLITGASSGIGQAAAVRAAALGAHVAIHYNGNRDGASETLARCAAAAAKPDAQRFAVFSGDLASGPDAAQALVTSVLAAFDRIDVLVNNAGRFIEHDVAASESTLAGFADVWRTTFATNVEPAAALTWLVGRHMAARAVLDADGFPTAAVGAIVNVGSRGAFRGEPVAWAYGASKAALHALSQCAAVALGKSGIVVTAVAPGFVATPMAAPRLTGPTGEAIARQSPWHRTATAEEVADAVLVAGRFWANAWLSGGVIDCNGASYLR